MMATKPTIASLNVTQLAALKAQGPVVYDDGTFLLDGDPAAGPDACWYTAASLSVPTESFTKTETYDRAAIDAGLAAKVSQADFDNLQATNATDAELAALQAQINAKPGLAIASILPVGNVWPKTVTWSDNSTTSLELPVADAVPASIVGHGTTLATLPQTRKDATPLVIGDWARLTQTDGTNTAGWYQVTAITPAIVYTYQWGELEADSVASNLITDGERVNAFGSVDDTTRPPLTSGDITGGAITVSGAANAFAMVLYGNTRGGPFNSHQTTFVVDLASWVDGSVFTVRLSGDGSDVDLVAVDKTGANVTETHPLASTRRLGSIKVNFVSAVVSTDVMTIIIETRHLGGVVNPVLRVGTLVNSQTVASNFTFIAAKQEVAAKAYADTIVGSWSGNFALTSGHQTLNVGFNINECDYLDLTLYDDGSNPWTWSGRIEGRSIEINSSRILVDRNGSSFVWARTAGVNPALGQIQFRDEGGVAQNVGQIVGYKRATVS